MSDQEQDQPVTPNSEDLMEPWIRERKEALARQLAANDETRKQWLASNPIEVSQRQHATPSNIKAQLEEKTEPKP